MKYNLEDKLTTAKAPEKTHKEIRKEVNRWLDAGTAMDENIKQQIRQAMKDNPKWIMDKFKSAIERYNAAHAPVDILTRSVKEASMT